MAKNVSNFYVLAKITGIYGMQTFMDLQYVVYYACKL